MHMYSFCFLLFADIGVTSAADWIQKTYEDHQSLFVHRYISKSLYTKHCLSIALSFKLMQLSVGFFVRETYLIFIHI